MDVAFRKLPNDAKPKIEYPCEWGYKVIGRQEAALRAAIARVVRDRPHRVRFSRMSSSGKYVCLEVHVVVHDEDERVTIFRELARHEASRVVL